MPVITKRELILDAMRPRANANFWGAQVATPAALPATGKPGEMRQVLDDGDGKPAVHVWGGSSWAKMADPDLLGGGPPATTSQPGVSELATSAETIAGTDTTRTTTPAGVAAAIAATPHSSLTGLLDDDHTQYFALVPTTMTFAATTPDTVRERVLFPTNSSHVKAIIVAAIGDAPTTGTFNVTAGSGAGGTSLITSGAWSLSGLTANDDAGEDNFSSMNLTGSDHTGDVGHGLTIEVVSSDEPITVMILFERD